MKNAVKHVYAKLGVLTTMGLFTVTDVLGADEWNAKGNATAIKTLENLDTAVDKGGNIVLMVFQIGGLIAAGSSLYTLYTKNKSDNPQDKTGHGGLWIGAIIGGLLFALPELMNMGGSLLN